MTILNGQSVGACEIRSPIGVGGTGEAYHASDRNRKSSLEPASEDPSRFNALSCDLTRPTEHEARALRRVNHPNPGPIDGREEFVAPVWAWLRHELKNRDGHQ